MLANTISRKFSSGLVMRFSRKLYTMYMTHAMACCNITDLILILVNRVGLKARVFVFREFTAVISIVAFKATLVFTTIKIRFIPEKASTGLPG